MKKDLIIPLVVLAGVLYLTMQRVKNPTGGSGDKFVLQGGIEYKDCPYC
jgi:hypothetical protein